MGQNLKSWQQYIKTLSASDQVKASSYFIGAACRELSQKQIGGCLKAVKELIQEGAASGGDGMEIVAKLHSTDNNMVELYHDQWLLGVVHIDNFDNEPWHGELYDGVTIKLTLTQKGDA